MQKDKHYIKCSIYLSLDDSCQFLYVLFLDKVAVMSQDLFIGLEAELVADEQAPGERWALLGF